AAGKSRTVAGVRAMRDMTLTKVLCASSGAVESLVAANGTRISLRPVGAEDRAGMTALFARLTPESRYQRFLSPKRQLTPPALTSLTIQHAHGNGLTSLTATTFWENHAARRLLRHHGFRARQSRGGEIEHELKLKELAAACVDEPTSEAGSAVGIAGLDAPF